MSYDRRPAVFLDKDGTLVEDKPYNVDCAKLQLASGAIDALQTLRAIGYRLVVVTNQSGIARGLFTVDDFRRIEHALTGRLAAAGVPLAGLFFCPHCPAGVVEEYAIECKCRKPRPGLFFQAARQLKLDLARSWMIGDILDDVEAAHRAGCRALLLDGGTETQWRRTPLRTPEAIVPNLRAAAQFIASGNAACQSPRNVSQEARP